MNIIEEKVIIDGESKIGATISHLENNEKQPLVLLIMGNVKNDRDGNMLGVKTDFYKNLSDMFVNMGYACIRYDKRGTPEASGLLGKESLSDLVKDSAKVIEYAKTLDFIDKDRIIACGHNQGTMVATLLTQQEKLEKIILLSGACMCLKSTLEYQFSEALDEFKNNKGLFNWFVRKIVNEKKIMKQLDDIFEKANESQKDKFYFRGVSFPTKWVKEHGELTNDDFVKMIEEYNGKVLAITGQADIQADSDCLDNIKEFENVVTYTPEKVNAILREVDDKNSVMTMKNQYKRLAKKPIHEETKKQIEEFLEK